MEGYTLEPIQKTPSQGYSLEPIEQEPNMAMPAFLVHNTKPQQQADNNKKAIAQGLPKELAAPATGPVDTGYMSQLIDKFKGLTGATRKHMGNVDVAKIAHDDTDNMTATEKALKPGMKGQEEAMKSIGSSLLSWIPAGLSMFIGQDIESQVT